PLLEIGSRCTIVQLEGPARGAFFLFAATMAGLPHGRGYKRWESHGSFCWRAYYVEQLEVVPQVVGILEYMLAVVDHALADERRRYSSCRDDHCSAGVDHFVQPLAVL